MAGMNMVIGVLAAVHARNIIGHGQRVDVALVDSVVVSLENAFTRYWINNEIYVRNGNAYAAICPYDTFQAKDGLAVIACGNQKLFEKFALDVAKHPEWVTDERFLTNVSRVAHMDELKELIEQWSSQLEVKEIVDQMLAAGVPAGPVYDVSQIVKDEHIAGAREMFPVVHHPVIGDMHVNGDAVKLMDTMPHVTRPAPLLGQDNLRVYAELAGLSAEDVEKYREAGIV